MPHTPATHLTVTPKRVYINGEPIKVDRDRVKLSDPNSGGMQTVTLTICPTSVTILNDDDPILVSAAHEAHTRRTRDEAGNNYSTYIHPNDFADMLDTWKRQEAARAKHTRATR